MIKYEFRKEVKRMKYWTPPCDKKCSTCINKADGGTSCLYKGEISMTCKANNYSEYKKGVLK